MVENGSIGLQTNDRSPFFVRLALYPIPGTDVHPVWSPQPPISSIEGRLAQNFTTSICDIRDFTITTRKINCRSLLYYDNKPRFGHWTCAAYVPCFNRNDTPVCCVATSQTGILSAWIPGTCSFQKISATNSFRPSYRKKIFLLCPLYFIFPIVELLCDV